LEFSAEKNKKKNGENTPNKILKLRNRDILPLLHSGFCTGRRKWLSGNVLFAAVDFRPGATPKPVQRVVVSACS